MIREIVRCNRGSKAENGSLISMYDFRLLTKLSSAIYKVRNSDSCDRWLILRFAQNTGHGVFLLNTGKGRKKVREKHLR